MKTTTHDYCGWHITRSDARPVTGMWRAERFGVGMCAGTCDALHRMIDQRCADEAAQRQAREVAR